MILYHSVSARSFRPLWTLEELGVAYELVVLPFPPRAHAPDYLELNPLGTVPLFIDGGLRMTESAAICQYLAERFGDGVLAVAPGDPAYGTYLNFLSYGEATLTFPQTLLLRYGRYEPEDRRAPQVVDDYTRWFFARLKGLETALSGCSYLCGERFTAADISVGYALMLADYLRLSDSFKANTKEYWRRLRARPGFQRAAIAETEAAVRQGVAVTPAPLA